MPSQLDEKLIKRLEEVGLLEWTTMNEWAKRHHSSYYKAYLAGYHKKIADEMGWGYKDIEKTKRDIIDFFNKNGRLPLRSYEKEKKLNNGLIRCCSPSSRSFDAEFNDWARANGHGADTVSLRKAEIKDFFNKNGRFPAKGSKNKHESNVGGSLSAYCTPTHGLFDSEFNDWARSKGYGADTVSLRKAEIKDFFNKNGRFPSARAKEKNERTLGQRLNSYCSRLSNTYDQDFNDWAKDNGRKNYVVSKV